MLSKEDTLKISELSSRCLDLCNNRDDLTDSDLDGAFMAVIMDAIRYGRGKAWKRQRINFLKEGKRLIKQWPVLPVPVIGYRRKAGSWLLTYTLIERRDVMNKEKLLFGLLCQAVDALEAFGSEDVNWYREQIEKITEDLWASQNEHYIIYPL
jgi:hypothetical protein